MYNTYIYNTFDRDEFEVLILLLLEKLAINTDVLGTANDEAIVDVDTEVATVG